MAAFDAWKYLHILMFVFWIGTDLGVYLSAKKSTDPKLSFETRYLLLHMALRIELLPRTMWKAALPLGVMLSEALGLIEIGTAGLIATWIFSIGWWAISMYGAYHYDKPIGHKFAAATNVVTGIVGVGLIAGRRIVAARQRPGRRRRDLAQLEDRALRPDQPDGHRDDQGVRSARSAFGRLAVEGSTPEIEGIIAGVMDKSSAIIWATYSTIALVAFIATTKII